MTGAHPSGVRARAAPATAGSAWRIVLLLGGTLALLASPAHGNAQARVRAVRAEMASVLLQSRRYDEAAHEYRVLLASEPRNVAHRLNLARALMWGGRPREAERELMVLISQRGSDPAVESMLLSARQQLQPSAREAAAWLRARPGSLDYRRLYARVLARERRTGAALAQYDTLVMLAPSNVTFLERSRVHAARRDFAAAERDVSASIQLRPMGEAYMARGDLLRTRREYAAARVAYWQGRQASADVDLAGAIAGLERDERPPIGLLPDTYGDQRGWTARSSATSDNLGVSMTTSSLRRGFWVAGADASVGARVRHFAGPVAAARGSASAFGADAAFSREGTHRQMMGRVRVRGGLLAHGGGPTIPELEVGAVGFYRAWGAGFELDVGAAYPDLLTPATYFPSPVTGELLRKQSATVSVAGPVGGVDVAASREASSLSDGNTMVTWQGLARHGVTRHFALLYAASAIAVAQPSLDYWSPGSYVSHAAGPELFVRRARGLSVSLRVLPGVAFTSRPAIDTTGAPDASALQLTAAAALAYRGTAWELGAGVSAGNARAGEYRRVDGSVYLRFAP